MEWLGIDMERSTTFSRKINYDSMAMFNVANCNQFPEGNQPVPVVVMPVPVTGHRSEQIDKGRIGGGAGPALLEKK